MVDFYYIQLLYNVINVNCKMLLIVLSLYYIDGLLWVKVVKVKTACVVYREQKKNKFIQIFLLCCINEKFMAKFQKPRNHPIKKKL